jgi:pimeloyl-ACP methyl ester carboxylesterase
MPFLSANDVKLYYESTGDGFPLVFCHEFAGDYRAWDPQVGFFARLYRCITYNHRGYPPSSVPVAPEAYSQEILIKDLRSLLKHLDIDRAHLIGFSLGANVVLNFALKYPELCESIVVTACGAGSTNRNSFEQRMAETVQLLNTRGIQALAESYAENPTRIQFKRKDPAGWARFRERMAEHSALGSALILQGVMLRRPIIFSLEEQLTQLRVPTLLIVGDEDENCVDTSVFMKRKIPSANLLMIPGSGHTVNLEEPALFNQMVSSFLHSVERRTGRNQIN